MPEILISMYGRSNGGPGLRMDQMDWHYALEAAQLLQLTPVNHEQLYQQTVVWCPQYLLYTGH